MSGKRPRKSKTETAGGPDPDEHYELSGDFRGAVINIKSTIVGRAEAINIESLPPEPGEPPYLGLQYYDEKDANRFFGREMLTSRIVGRLHRTRMLAIIGASGSGKSSLVRAGVIPAIRGGQRLADGGLPPPDSGRWAIQVITPTAHPLESLAVSLLKDTESITAVSALKQELAQDEHALSIAARKVLAQGSYKHFLLVIDQFEEVYTLCRSEDERRALIDNVLEAVNPDDSQPVTVVIVLRADFYPYVAQHDRLRETISQYQEFIGGMNRDELVSAIDKPLALGDWKIQEGLIEVILDDIGYEPGALPLLSHALHETWLRRRGRTLTLSAYTEAGGIRGAIAQTAENVFSKQLTAEQQPIARMIFLRMSEIIEDARVTRRRAAFTELITRSTDELVIQTVINILVDARLVIAGTVKPGDTKVVEVAHEAVIQEWPTLQRWLEEDREGLLLHQNLAEATADWFKLAKDSSILYRGLRLERALEWAATHPEMLSLHEQDFLQKSQQREQEEIAEAARLRRAARFQRALIALTLVLVATLAYSAYRFWFDREPVVMDGFYNIAVADFGSNQGGGVATPAPGDAENGLSDQVAMALKEQLGDNPNILIWHDGPELKQQDVEIGRIAGADAGARTDAAAEVARRLRADMVIYGYLDQSKTPPVPKLEYYLAPQQDFHYEDIQGGFQFSEPGTDSAAGSPDPENQITRQSTILAWIALGLTEGQLGHSLEALESFIHATEIDSESPMLQFFLGREYLFLVDRESVLKIAQQEFEDQAEMAFKRALAVDPGYSRAWIGLGGVYFKQAQRTLTQLIQDSSTSTPSNTDVEKALTLVDQAEASFVNVIDAAQPESAVGVPVKSIAGLSLGNAYRLAGQIHQIGGDSSKALEAYEQSILTLNGVISPLEEGNHARYLTQAYEYLAAVYQWKGYSLEVMQDFEKSLEAYQRSADYYDQCIAQADSTQDLIIKDEIVGDICVPNKSTVLEAIDNLAGGQG